MSKLLVVKLPDHKISSETKSFVPNPITEIVSKFSLRFLNAEPKINAVIIIEIPIINVDFNLLYILF